MRYSGGNRAIFEQVRDRRESIRELTEKYVEIRQRLLSPSSASGSYDHNRTPESRTERLYEKADNLRIKILELIIEKAELQRELERDISKLTNFREQNVMFMRYVLNLKWREIAERMECCEREVYKVHGRALRNYDKLCTEKQHERGKGSDSIDK